MRFVLFYHSLASDWNHGNAHFLRGVAAELIARGHDVRVYEPENGWSATNLRAEHGERPFAEFAAAFPALHATPYDPATLDVDRALDGADVAIVHEWNEPEVVRRIGQHRAAGGHYALFFHDTHHRSVTDPASMGGLDLAGYDGVLAYGAAVREQYLKRGWARRVWVWHEAADTRVFFPREGAPSGDLVWIGNWGDDERTAELMEYLVGPVRTLSLRATIFGVRYSAEALTALAQSGATYGGWIANYRVPDVFSRFRVTVHVPRRAYTTALPGVPTIRPFEALACGIPLVSSPWHDSEGLFRVGTDFLMARSGAEMTRLLSSVLSDADLARALARNGLETILARHTCEHRVDELLAILGGLHGVSRRNLDAHAGADPRAAGNRRSPAPVA